ncbi:MAG: dihydrofolate reductase family protein [Acidimicrobiales bacterium]
MLVPDLQDPVDPLTVYVDRPQALGRPGVRVNMVASTDGATAVAGRAGALGDSGDRVLFRLMRSLADVILVGASTVRREGYRPASAPIAVVTGTCRLDWSASLFTPGGPQPIVFTSERSDRGDRQAAAAVAEVVVVGDRAVSMAGVMADLGGRGYVHVLAEGGPVLNASLAEAGLVDEVCLTVSPLLVGGASARIMGEADLATPVPMTLVSVLEESGSLYTRYRPAAIASHR